MHLRDFHQSHKDQRIKASLKPHEALRKTLQKPEPASGGNDARAGLPSADRLVDKIQAASPNNIQREAGQTVGTPSADRLVAEVQAASRVIERKGILATLMVVIMMVVVGLGLVKFLFGRPYAKRVLAFSAMRRSQRPQDYLRLLDLSSRQENQVEADPGAASCANSVKKALDAIEQAAAETASSRQPRTPNAVS